jgi:hypothetical protein
MASSRQSLPGAHQLLIACRGRGVDATETKHGHGHADCAADLASTPHDAFAPPVYVVPAMEAASGASFFASAAAASSSGKRGRVEDHQFVGATKRQVIDVHPAVLHHVSALTFFWPVVRPRALNPLSEEHVHNHIRSIWRRSRT